MSRVSLGSGVLATRGDLVFAASGDGTLIALDARSGEALWSFRTDGMITASPMSYAIDGRQYVAIAAGASVYTFALPPRSAAAGNRGLAGR
jgi:glucose dehydrogenase